MKKEIKNNGLNILKDKGLKPRIWSDLNSNIEEKKPHKAI